MVYTVSSYETAATRKMWRCYCDIAVVATDDHAHAVWFPPTFAEHEVHKCFWYFVQFATTRIQQFDVIGYRQFLVMLISSTDLFTKFNTKF